MGGADEKPHKKFLRNFLADFGFFAAPCAEESAKSQI
jgi:hypothetical protein